MAHPSIDERRRAVQQLLDQGINLNQARRRELAQRFSCDPSAITADIKFFKKDPNTETMHTSSTMRRRIRLRDGKICQYCGIVDFSKNYIIEHTIPAPEGPAREYNLVVACDSCNSKKGKEVWIPHNIAEIVVGKPEWEEKIRTSAITNQPTYREPSPEERELAFQEYRAMYSPTSRKKALAKLHGLLEKAYDIVFTNSALTSDNWQQKFRRLVIALNKEETI